MLSAASSSFSTLNKGLIGSAATLISGITCFSSACSGASIINLMFFSMMEERMLSMVLEYFSSMNLLKKEFLTATLQYSSVTSKGMMGLIQVSITWALADSLNFSVNLIQTSAKS